jgi:hypothetical protein
MNNLISWQTNGPQDHNIILNQLLDHPLNLQENLRQRSFVATSEWFQESVSRTCCPIRKTHNEIMLTCIFFNAMRINSSSSSSMKTTTTTPKISEKSFNHSKKLENFWGISEEIHRQTSTNYLAVRRSCTIHFFNVNLKGVNQIKKKNLT